MTQSESMDACFLHHVLGWNKSICENENLFKRKIKQLPGEFDDIGTWSRSFNVHILEDMRSSIKKELASPDFMKTAFTTMSGNLIELTKENTKVTHRCLVLLESKKENFFAEIIRSRIGLNAFSFRLKDKRNEEKFFEDEAKGWDLFILPTTIPSERIWNALNITCNLPGSQLLQEMLSCGVSYDNVAPNNLLNSRAHHTLSQYLNDSQQRSIRSVISTIRSHSTNGSHIQIIHGPPGTGKTNTLASLILTVLHDKLGRLHVAAPTNLAIVELSCRTLKVAREHAANGMEHSFMIRHLLLVGNGERMTVPSNLKEIFIDTRIERLVEGLSDCPDVVSDLKMIHCAQFSDNIDIIDGNMKDDSTDVKAASDKIPDLQETLCRCIKFCTVIRDEIPTAFIIEPPRDFFEEIIVEANAYLNSLKSSQKISSAPLERHESWTKMMELINSKKCDQAINHAIKFLKMNFSGQRTAIMNEAQLVFSTVSGGGGNIFYKQNFDVAIIDEATQLVEAATSIMILNPKLKCLILAGDNKQLPSTVLSDLAKNKGYSVSLFERLLNHNFPSNLLSTQYRMHPDISSWPNTEFYNRRIIDGPNVLSTSYNKYWHDSFPPFSIYDVRGTEEEYLQSHLNRLEVSIVASLIREIYSIILHAPAEDIGVVKIGILSPYSAQTELLKERIQFMKENLQKSRIEIICRSIDGFQGQECDIIILSTVRSNENKKLGFLKDPRRLNVAITRSRYSLIIVGNCDTLSSNEVWKRLIDSATHKKIEQNSPLIEKVILKFRKENQEIEEVKVINGSTFEKSLWSKKIVFKDTFKKSYPLIKDKNKRERILNLLLRLAKGNWSRCDQPIVEIDSKIDFNYIINSAVLNGEYLVWSVDLEVSQIYH